MVLTSFDKKSECKELTDSGRNIHEGNVGWADSIAKILNTTKPKNKKVLILSRAKRIKQCKTEKIQVNYDFEIDGEIKNEITNCELENISKQNKNLKLELRVQPTWKDIECERALRKVATRGVVQLFNAVRTQQRDLQYQLKKAGPLDSRKEAVLNSINKRKFLDVLMSGKRSKSEKIFHPVENESKEESSDDSVDSKKKSAWNVLRDDFMTDKKTKYWDEDESEAE